MQNSIVACASVIFISMGWYGTDKSSIVAVVVDALSYVSWLLPREAA